MRNTRSGRTSRDGGYRSSTTKGNAGSGHLTRRGPDILNSNSSRSSSTTACSKEGAEEHIGATASVSGLSNKRKRMDAQTYRALFKPLIKANSTDLAVAIPDKAGKENTSSGNVADRNTGILCELGGFIGKNNRHPTDPAYKLPRNPVSGLHESSQTRADKCTAPLSEAQQHKSTDVCPQNRVVESRLAVEDRERPPGHASQDPISSSRNAPAPLIRYEEKSGLGDGEPIGTQKEYLDSRRFKVIPSDETEGNSNICIACRTPGDLKSCDGKGCKRSYHISCLDPWLEYFSPGIWFCTICTEKRLLFGIHSIADIIESVWNVKEGMQNGKQYFVKYKNLAHVHNRWVPESTINDIPGGPDLLCLFSERDHKEKTSWKEEWTEPHRLLRKRLLMLPKAADEFFCSTGANLEPCNVEWLVKWRDLGYEHATWELETSYFLCTPQADELKRKYENRCKAAKQSSIPIETKVKQKEFQELQRLPDEWPPGFDNDHLFSINQLREFWCKSYGAVLVDDKEYVIKTILFMLTVLPDVCQPFLIVVTPASLSAWEVQFNHLAPFVNVVVYDGGKDTLKLTQDLEFYGNRNCMILQVLLSHPDAILEDIETIEHIRWEAVIVDYYQNSALKYLEQLKKLHADFRMVLLSSPIKDNLPEYTNLLAFLNPAEKDYSNCVGADDALATLKARFTHHIAYERKADSSNFLEYWIPSYISQEQLEVYCNILISKSSVLQSQMKTDSVGTLHDICLSLKKCCDHPYLIDEYLQSSRYNNNDVTENIDTEMHASGKLLLLDKMLKEIRKKRLRVIVLFQSGGTGRNTMGSILEGFVHHRFGPDSCERVEYGTIMSMKHAAINKFNDETNGRFVFLIENRACLPSIKLSSIDAIIIYGTDRNPLNDLKALQKIKIESHVEHVSVFRLYTPFTVEEKSLVLAKQGVLIDKNIQGLRIHTLLSWGASYLFARLDEVQQDNACKSSEMDTLFVDEIIIEFLTKLSTNVGGSTNRRSISKANMSGEHYSRNITLIGEKKGISELEEDPAKFWLNLLNGRSPRGIYISGALQSRIRKSHTMDEVKVLAEEIDKPRKKRTKVGEIIMGLSAELQSRLRKSHTLDEVKVSAEEIDEPRKKRTKVGGIIMGSSSEVLSGNSNDDALPEICTTSRPALLPVDDTQQELGSESLMSTPKNLHIQFKQELSKLIKVLQLPDNVMSLVGQFLEHILNNHLVSQEPKDTLHALNIALCWRAASLLNFKMDRRESLALAEKSLKYECNEKLTRFVYDRLRTLKKHFRQKAGAIDSNCESTSIESTKPSWKETSPNLRNDHMLPEQRMDLHDNFINGALQEGSCDAVQMVPKEQELIAVPGAHREYHLSTDELPEIVEKRIDLVDNVFALREKHILDKQQSEISELETHTENKTIRLKEESSAGEYTSIENVERDNTNPSTSLVMGVNTNNDVTVAADHVNLESTMLASPQNLMALSVSREVGSQHNLSTLSAPQTVGTSQHPFAGAEPTETLGVMMTGDLQSEMQTSISALDSPFQKMCPDENNQTVHQPDTATGPLQEGATSSHLASVDASEGVTEKNAAAAAADLLESGTQSYTAASKPTDMLVAREVETQTDQSSILEQQSTSLPPKQSSVASQHPPAEAEAANILSMETARDMQLEMQPSASMLDAPPQDMHDDDNSQIKQQMETAPDLSQRGGTSQGVDANNSNTIYTVRGHSELPTFATPQSLATQGNISNVAPSQHPPAEAERTGLLITQAAQDLHSEMQPSTSLLDAPCERNNRNQTDYQPDRTTVFSQEVATAYHHLGDARVVVDAINDDNVAENPLHSESPFGLPVSTEVETQICQSSMSVQQSTNQSAQQSPVGIEATQELQPGMQPSTSVQDQSEQAELEGLSSSAAIQDLQPEMQHPNSVQDEYAGAEQESMLSTAASHDLQPEMQPPTPVQDQLAEADQEDMLSAAAAQNLQSEMEQSTSMQDAPFEGTDLSGMPVQQSITVDQSVVPSWDPHAGVEPTGALCMETAHVLQSELQPSGSMQRPAGAGVSTSCIMTAHDLQPQMDPSSTMQPVPLERTCYEDRNQVGLRPNTASGPERSTQPFPVAPMMCNYPTISGEPLKNELDRLKHCSNFIRNAHEKKKTQLRVECDQEIEKLKMKYDLLIQKEDSAYSQTEAALDNIYRKVFMNHSLAEGFRGKFMLSSAAQVRSIRPTMWQPVQSAQEPSARILAAQVTASLVSVSPATRPWVFHSREPYVQSSPLSLQETQPESILPGNIYRTTSSPFSTMCLPHGSYRAAGTHSHAPALHLQQLRMAPPHATVHRNQQLPVSSGVTSLRQLVPGIMENFASTIPQAGSMLTSMAPNSVHQMMQTISSASNSHPAIPASSLPSSPLLEFMANFNLMAPQLPNIVVHSTSGPLDAAAGSQYAGAQMSGVNHSGSASASLNAWLSARPGLASEPRGTSSTAEVVCLSDDES
ncbi:hypothetical protein ABZP36_021127 [Zizania latifolia]